MTLMLTIGIPAAGKTTICKSIIDRRPDTVVFTFDRFANGRMGNSTAHAIRKNFECTVRNYLVNNSAESDEFKRLIVVDDNFYLKSMQRPFERMARAFRMHFRVLFIPCDLNSAIDRNEKRDKYERVKETTIRRMYKELEIPVNAIIYREDQLSLVLESLLKTKRPEVERKWKTDAGNDHCNRRCFKSESPSIEGELRSVVSDLMKNNEYDGKRMSIAKKKVAVFYSGMKSCSYNKNELKARILKAYEEERWVCRKESYYGTAHARLWRLRRKNKDEIEYTVLARKLSEKEDDDDNIMKKYLQLDVDLTSLYDVWSAGDCHIHSLLLNRPHLKGIRILDQEPLETLFAFICSSNNNIKRISSKNKFNPKIMKTNGLFRKTVEKLSLIGTDTLLLLREKDLNSAREILRSFTGVGPKVCIFSHGKFYKAQFGEYAGWAQAIIFNSQLAEKKSDSPQTQSRKSKNPNNLH
uniref:OGG_N domain-containing protein n=1 Tax=Heterorhabditis bacteriophora TaxID=37862 RepID=A0A1I7XW02_HETBA